MDQFLVAAGYHLVVRLAVRFAVLRVDYFAVPPAVVSMWSVAQVWFVFADPFLAVGVPLPVGCLVDCSADFPGRALECSVNHFVLVWFVDQFLAAVCHLLADFVDHSVQVLMLASAVVVAEAAAAAVVVIHYHHRHRSAESQSWTTWAALFVAAVALVFVAAVLYAMLNRKITPNNRHKSLRSFFNTF